MAFASIVCCLTSSDRAVCNARMPCCSTVLTGTNLTSGREAASQIAAASAASFFLPFLTKGLTHLGQQSFLLRFLPESDQWVSAPRWRICIGRPLNCGATSHSLIEFMQLKHGYFRDFSARLAVPTRGSA